MSSVYLVALLISQASGDVQSIKVVDAVTEGGCRNIARQLHANDPAPQGYEAKFTCGTRAAMENAVADNNCKLSEQKNANGFATTIYVCDPSLKNKVVRWVRNVL